MMARGRVMERATGFDDGGWVGRWGGLVDGSLQLLWLV